MNRWLDILSGRRRDLPATLLRAATTAAVPFYAAAVALRHAAYRTGLLACRPAHCPVISIGNLTTGGTGKTPMTIYLAGLLVEMGARPGVILRGYRPGPDGTSDEQRELAQALPGLPVIARPDRLAAAAELADRFPQVNVILLDDAFQHRRIARQLDLVLIDATNPFGYGHLLPRGLMREPPAGLARADAIIVTRADHLQADQLHRLDRRLADLHGKPPLAHAAHRWTGILDQHDRPVQPEERPVLAFCGLGNPSAFFHQAGRHCRLVATHAFADHHPYRPADLHHLLDQARRSGAQALLTTGKDWVKLRRLIESSPVGLPLWRVRLAVELLDGEPALRRRLQQVLDS